MTALAILGVLFIVVDWNNNNNKLGLVEVGGGVEPLLSDNRPALRVIIQKARLVKSWLIMTHDDDSVIVR